MKLKTARKSISSQNIPNCDDRTVSALLKLNKFFNIFNLEFCSHYVCSMCVLFVHLVPPTVRTSFSHSNLDSSSWVSCAARNKQSKQCLVENQHAPRCICSASIQMIWEREFYAVFELCHHYGISFLRTHGVIEHSMLASFDFWSHHNNCSSSTVQEQRVCFKMKKLNWKIDDFHFVDIVTLSTCPLHHDERVREVNECDIANN